MSNSEVLSPGVADYTAITSIADVWPIAARHFGETVALRDPHRQPEVSLTFAELNQQLHGFAAGLQALGVEPGDRISIVADNSPRWLIADQGSLMAGAVNVVRSSQADAQELAYILEHSGSTALLVEDLKTLRKLKPFLGSLPLKFVGLMSDEEPEPSESVKMLSFNQIFTSGAASGLKDVSGSPDRLAILMYTSGTTGQPKGVMLSHGNYLFQLTHLRSVLQPEPGDRVLSILPSWHVFGRIVDYFFLSQGCTQIYTSIRHVKKDLQVYKPQFMGSVPRLWESIYEGIQKQFRQQSKIQQLLINQCFSASQRYILAQRTLQGLDLINLKPSGGQRLQARIQTLLALPLHALGKKLVYGKVNAALGGNFKYSLSGGGSLAMHIENFFEIVGIDLLVGYGLTETAPVLTARRPRHNLRRSSGRPIPKTELKIVDLKTRQALPLGETGLVLARGPQVMQGYYHNPEATAKAIDPEGWFDTGDLGWMTDQQDLIITGRSKDTIVLSNGENIEPQPLEDACARSTYIDQLVVVGQDQRLLGALIVPNLEVLQQWAISQNATLKLPPVLQDLVASAPAGAQAWDLDSQPVQELFRQELLREVKNRPGYRADDRIGVFKFILEPFTIENGLLTQTLKIKRPVVAEQYRTLINEMFI
ncbi:Long-chain-fatty-acid--CoA ligase FadD15 [Acaryochloris thomasi RCC1774]|uniref:Long-chain-fatty-acid--CoA ligase FadD15 n=1 Tax=Acaryochloris thomasi RCC1774 TaxID=1764569 RepID=A0A2W1JSA6_9CYAN|nr:AMP-binding protein [Acaryochloris thomasi]PZD74095.1 Long-chain-fatty-acid--CoA ligase FadD15 [Acaryochloris thomasi RCC1774]